jgi:uncharacterized membrane protein
MVLLVIAALGVASGYLALWSSVVFYRTTEERVKNLLYGVVIDVILLAVFAINGYGTAMGLILIFKYLFLSAINFDKTLRQ